MTFGDDDDGDSLEEAVEDAHADGVKKGRDEASSNFGYGCLFGIALTLTLIYFGWCTPYTR